MWACIIGLFQVIIVVNSPEYRDLYGDNGMKPIKKPSNDTRFKSQNVKLQSSLRSNYDTFHHHYYN